MRKVIRQLHLLLGLLSGTVVFVVSLTGCMCAFEEEIRSAWYRDIFQVKEQPAPFRPLSEMVASAKESLPGQKVRNIRVHSPHESVEVNFKNKETVFVNPYNTTVLGRLNRDQDVLGIIEKIHRTLYLGDAGKIITGTSALIFTFMLISGIILWWPKNGRFTSRRFSISMRSGIRKKIYDLHSVLGFYASWIILFTALTGIIFSFKWAENTLYFFGGSDREALRGIKSSGPPSSPEVVDLIHSHAMLLFPQTQECLILLPDDSISPVRLVMRTDNSGFFRKQHRLFFDQKDAGLLKTVRYEETVTGEKLRTVNYDIHTGKVMGLPGQVAVFLASLVISSMPVTGLLMWLARRKKNGSIYR